MDLQKVWFCDPGGSMFAQVINGRATGARAMKALAEQWYADRHVGADGWLGTTGGVTGTVRVTIADVDDVREMPEQLRGLHRVAGGGPTSGSLDLSDSWVYSCR